MGLEDDLVSLSEATSGAIGSLLSTTLLDPLDTCKTRYQAEVRPYAQLSYFKRVYLRKSDSKIVGTKANLILAAATGACTAIVTLPLDRASARMQTSEFGKSQGLWEALAKGNLGDAFDGLWISLLLASNPAIRLKQRLLARKEVKGSYPVVLSAFLAFLLRTVSKSNATVFTYPAIRCKAMI